MNRFMLFLFAGIASIFAGCDGAKYVTVSGKVTLNGKPLANAIVSYQPVAKQDLDAASFGSYGTTDQDGNYTLEVGGPTPMKGAAVGKHVVRIGSKPADAASDSDAINPGGKKTTRVNYEPIPARYNTETTLSIDVPSSGTTTANFDLTSP